MGQDTTTPPATATLACGHDIYVTPAQEDAGKAFHCGQFRAIADPPPLSPYDSSVTDDAGATGPDPRRAASVAALRDLAAGYAQLADAIEARPDIPAPYPETFGGAYVLLCVQTAGELAAAARALPCTLRKEPTEKYFELHGQLGGLEVQLYAAREKVCTVTGYEDREVEEVVTPAVTQTVVKPMPVWECAPVLAAERTAIWPSPPEALAGRPAESTP
jgi:hypothetical protein